MEREERKMDNMDQTIKIIKTKDKAFFIGLISSFIYRATITHNMILIRGKMMRGILQQGIQLSKKEVFDIIIGDKEITLSEFERRYIAGIITDKDKDNLFDHRIERLKNNMAHISGTPRYIIDMFF